MKPAIKKLISSIPAVDQLLRDPLGIDLQNKFGRKIITSRIRILTAVRIRIREVIIFLPNLFCKSIPSGSLSNWSTAGIDEINFFIAGFISNFKNKIIIIPLNLGK